MSISSAYTNWAATYDTDRNLTRDLDQIITRDTLGQQHYEVVLELGCGTGKNTGFLAGIAGHVYAFDFSSGMIAQAKAKIQQENVTFTVTDLTQPWPCADGCVNLVTSNLVLEHIEDLPFIFSEALRVLADRGRFFISELHPFRQYQGKKATFQRDEQQIEIPAFVHHVSDFLDAAASAGFTLVSLKERWHEADEGRLPRIIALMFER